MAAKLDFIVGRAGAGKSNVCLSAMRARMREDPLGAPLILLVPEHMTYRMERDLVLPIERGQGFLRGYVFGFRRLAHYVLNEIGTLSVPRISEIGRRLLLRKILTRHQKKGDLTAFGRAIRQRGFTESLSDGIREMKSCRLTRGILAMAADTLRKQEMLAEKLREMAVLSEEFAAEMHGKANDEEDMMEQLAQAIPTCPFFKDAEIWIDGFYFLNPQQLEVLSSLLLAVKAIHVTLPLDGRMKGSVVRLDSMENVSETGIFYRAYETYLLIKKMACERVGIQKSDVLWLNAEARCQKPFALRHLEQNLFRRGKVSPVDGAGIALTEASNKRLEIEAVASDILKHVREAGWRYREIGVLLRDAKSYEPLIRLVFADADIPFFVDGKRPSTHHSLAELLRASLEVVQKNWPYEAIFRALRTGFFPLVRDEIDTLENYVLEFGIRGKKRWFAAENWNFFRRFSLDSDETISSETLEKVKEIDGFRRTVGNVFSGLSDALSQAKNVREIVTALYDFLTVLKVPERLSEWRALAETEGRLADAAEHEKIWSDIMNLFDQMVEITGDEAMPLKDFIHILDDGLDALSISLIPPGLDYVTIASFDKNSLSGTRGIYIVGADADTMPQQAGQVGMFSDAERMHILDAFRTLRLADGTKPFFSRGSMDQSFSEKFLMYRAFTESSEYLWVSYALAKTDGTGIAPSPIVRKMRELFTNLNFRSIPLAMVERKDDLLLYAPRPAISGLVSALQDARAKKTLAPLWQDVYNWMLKERSGKLPIDLALSGLFAEAGNNNILPLLAQNLFAPKKYLRGSVSQFEIFRKCPFAHFVKYGLKIEERRSYAFKRYDFGLILHEVMREYGEFVKRDYGSHWEDVPKEVRKAESIQIVDAIAPRLESEVLLSRANYRHLIERMKETVLDSIEHLTAWAALSSFQPTYLEEGFGSYGDKVKLTPLPLKGGFKLSFKGRIDRIDVHSTTPYYLVIDYKTHTIAINLFEVYYGLRLQLLVYLLVGRELLKQSGKERLPAGILYALLLNPTITTASRMTEDALKKEILKKLQMPGWVLMDPEVIRSIDSSFNYIGPSLKKNEEFTSASAKYMKTQEEFANLLDYVNFILQDTGNEILSGNIKAYPFRDGQDTGCMYCAFHAVCSFDATMPGYAYNDVDHLNDSEAKEKIEAYLAEKNGEGARK